MKWTDWRGNEYGPGDTILYPRQSGRCVEMCEAVVEDVYQVWREGLWTAWKRADGTQPPDSQLELRVVVRPTGGGARGFHRTETKTIYLDANDKPTTYEKAADNKHEPVQSFKYNVDKGQWVEVTRYCKRRRIEPVPIKPVTLTITENITVPERRSKSR